MLFEEENLLEIFERIAEENGFRITESEPLYGGDINRVYLLKTTDMNLVLKINDKQLYPGMFDAETKGLQALKHSGSFRIPEVMGLGETETRSYLLMEYIASGQPVKNFWVRFAQNLAKMHHKTQKEFGLGYPNYIGSLVQQNDGAGTAAGFFIESRIKPMLGYIRKKGFNLEVTAVFYENIAKLIPEEPPALIHGDLWNGNYLVSKEGEAVLIDPAVAYAPREMDLAMMKLFGGFPDLVFDAYDEIFPLEKGWKQRIDIWQLYYILVHLALFGAGYLASARAVIKKYS